MKNPKISVIMSVYNSEKFLSEAIESILNQTFKDFEFIIINDCSTDSSLEIIKKYKKKDSRIVLIENKKNIGLTKSLNIGLKRAKGKYIARMDADDISLPERFQIQYDFLEKNKDIFLVGTGAYDIDEQGNPLKVKKVYLGIDKIKEMLPSRNCFYHPTIMFRNEGFYYRDKFIYSQDYDFYFLLLTKGKLLENIPVSLLEYRISSDSISQSKLAKQRLFKKKAQEFYKQRLKNSIDEYDKFDPDEILDVNPENSVDETVLSSEIKTRFKRNDFVNMRSLCKRYFQHYGFLNKYLIYYLLSFTGKKTARLVKKIVF
jgi:glycosyltransferase involved in cell wall biosynthesis